MAEVLDIITRLTYDAQTGGLDKAYAAIENQINAINQQAESILRLEALQSKVSKSDITRQNQITIALENRRRKIADLTKEIGKEVQANDKLKVSLLNQFGAYQMLINNQGKLVKSTNQASSALFDFTRIIQDAPYGIQGVANNIDQAVGSFGRLFTSAGSAKEAFKQLGTSLIGGAGIGLAISLVTSLLVAFGDELFRSADAADEANESYKAFLKTLSSDSNSAIRAINEQTNKANLLYRVIQSGGAGAAAALKQLREEYPNLTKELTDADIQAGKGLDIIQKQIKAREVGNLASKAQLELQGQLNKAEEDLSATRERNATAQAALTRAQQAFNNASATRQEAAFTILQRAKTDADAASAAVRGAEQNVKNFRDSIQRAGGVAASGFNQSSGLQDSSNPSSPPSARAQRNVKENAKIRLGVPTDPDLESISQDIKEIEQLSKILQDIYSTSSLSPENLIGGGGETTASRRLKNDIQLQQDLRKKEESDARAAQEKRKENIDNTKELYFSLRDTVLGVLNDIYDRQIRALDDEINIRSQRVEQAKELAERGNTEILRLEQERLQESEKQRREAAQRQIAINNALALSNAIVAVATTAAESGVASIATIPAVLAALVAGYSFVRSLDGVGFKKGGYTGDGSPNEAAGPVHKREFVFNERLTSKHRELFETIHRTGEIPLAYTATMLPNGGFATKKELKTLGDRIVGAIYDAPVNMKQVMDRNGMMQQIERDIRTNKRLWS